jgi:hypothetical protein
MNAADGRGRLMGLDICETREFAPLPAAKYRALNRFVAASPASATIPGTTIDAAITRDILGGLATGTTVSWRSGFDVILNVILRRF